MVSLVRGNWRLRVSEAERRVRDQRVCKVDSYRDKTGQCPWYIYSRECLYCTEFFVGLEAGGEIETAKCAVKENAEAFDRVGERDCGIIKPKGVDRKLLIVQCVRLDQ